MVYKKIKSKTIKKNKKKSIKLNGGGNNVIETKCKKEDLKSLIKLSDILKKSKDCVITSLITFQNKEIKIEISNNNIIFKMGENNDMDCITLEIHNSYDIPYSKLYDYFFYTEKIECIKKLGFKKEEVNEFFFNLFDAINIELNIEQFLLEDGSHLKLNMCEYELNELKMLESGYGFYNKLGFYYETKTINEMNRLLIELEEKSKFNIIKFFGDELTEEFKTYLDKLYTEYLKLENKDLKKNNKYEKSFVEFCNSTTMRQLCKYILKICNQKQDESRKEYIKKLITEDIIRKILFILHNELKIKYKIEYYFNLNKIYDKTTITMSSFNTSKKNFEMIPYKKYNFEIEYIKHVELNVSNSKSNKLNEFNKSNEPIFYIKIN
jgi:hypothetical protein